MFTAAGTTLRGAVLKTQTTGRVWAEDPDTGVGAATSASKNTAGSGPGPW